MRGAVLLCSNPDQRSEEVLGKARRRRELVLVLLSHFIYRRHVSIPENKTMSLIMSVKCLFSA